MTIIDQDCNLKGDWKYCYYWGNDSVLIFRRLYKGDKEYIVIISTYTKNTSFKLSI